MSSKKPLDRAMHLQKKWTLHIDVGTSILKQIQEAVEEERECCAKIADEMLGRASFEIATEIRNRS